MLVNFLGSPKCGLRGPFYRGFALKADQRHASKDKSLSSFSGHWREAKWRFAYILFSLLVTFFVCFHFGDSLLYFFSTPLGWLEAQSSLPVSTLSSPTSAGSVVDSAPKGQLHFIYTEVTEAFVTYLLLSFSFACYFTFPLLAYHFYAFLKPGFHRYEAALLSYFLGFSCFLFLLANFWTYFYFLPMILEFFLSFGGAADTSMSVAPLSEEALKGPLQRELGRPISDLGTDSESSLGSSMGSPQTDSSLWWSSPTNALQAAGVDLQFSARILPFVSFVLGVGWQMGICFQFPLYFFLLLRLGLLPRGAFAKPLGRKIFFVLALIVAACLTPPDVISQVILVTCIQVFFELSLFLVFFVEAWSVKPPSS
jgi:sec-independent protein translocase protein TatC